MFSLMTRSALGFIHKARQVSTFALCLKNVSHFLLGVDVQCYSQLFKAPEGHAHNSCSGSACPFKHSIVIMFSCRVSVIGWECDLP